LHIVVVVFDPQNLGRLSSTDCSLSQAARWAVIVALEIFTELLIIGFPIWFISKNELRASKKRIVVFVYSFRVLVAALSVIGIILYIGFIRSGASNIGLVPVVVLEEVLLCMSLLTASIPCLKPFVWAFMSRRKSFHTSIQSPPHKLTI
jgi:hypothetical protein